MLTLLLLARSGRSGGALTLLIVLAVAYALSKKGGALEVVAGIGILLWMFFAAWLFGPVIGILSVPALFFAWIAWDRWRTKR